MTDASKFKDECIELLHRRQDTCAKQGDLQGEIEAELARAGALAHAGVIERRLGAGVPRGVLLQALAHAIGLNLAFDIIAMTAPGQSEAAVTEATPVIEASIPAILDIARAFAATQDRRAMEEAGQERLFQ